MVCNNSAIITRRSFTSALAVVSQINSVALAWKLIKSAIAKHLAYSGRNSNFVRSPLRDLPSWNRH